MSSTATYSLRAWQQQALARYIELNPRDFLAVATPGAGKTTFALTLAAEMLSRRMVQRVIVVTPTEHLKVQWAEAAARLGIGLDPTYTPAMGALNPSLNGIAVTYAGVAANSLAYRISTEKFPTLVILDELHHAGDALSWGQAIYEAFEPAERRIGLTGTPFRSDSHSIPFVTYTQEAPGVYRSAADYTYGYGEALADQVVRPVLFWAYSGDLQWRTRAGDEITAQLDQPMTKELAAQALRTALDPQGAWIRTVLQAADTRLSQVRKGVPDAGGLVIATDQEDARAYAALIKQLTGEPAVLVLSDEAAASKRIAEFSKGDQRWMVAVRMVSEGVDVPRLAVGVYATTTSTPLFFAQAVGRFVRARSQGETASIFLPSMPLLLQYAAELERERDHVLERRIQDADDLLEAEAARAEPPDQDLLEDDPAYEAIDSQATFAHVLYEGDQFDFHNELETTADAAELDFLGIPGLLDADQVRTLLQQRSRRREESAPATAAVDTHQQLLQLRQELNTLVGAWHHRSGEPHGVIHMRLRQACGGPAIGTATAAELQQRIDLLRQWATSRART